MKGSGQQIGSRNFLPTEMPSPLSLKNRDISSVYRHSIRISQDAIDANGHANNVEYLRWMQDAAVGHSDATGCTDATRKAGASWVVRSITLSTCSRHLRVIGSWFSPGFQTFARRVLAEDTSFCGKPIAL